MPPRPIELKVNKGRGAKKAQNLYALLIIKEINSAGVAEG
jgi:hypothetical protein